MKNEKQNPVVVKLSENAGVKNTGNLHAYVVNAGGQIVESAAFADGEAKLSATKSSLAGQSKVYIAQAFPQGTNAANQNELGLLKMNAYEAVKNVNSDNIVISRLPGNVIDPPLFFFCNITGHVTKNFTIDGQTQNLPLCDMRVHICNVETELRWPHIPIYFRKIPDSILQDVAQKILALQPNPVPGPGPVENVKINIPLSSLTARAKVKATQAKPYSALPQNVVASLVSGSAESIRQAMIDHYVLFYPYICLWPYFWPWFYISTELGVVDTDCNGHFDLWELVFKQNSLNIYIWVEANINGQWVTVYRPSLPCNTFWGYVCNTDIEIVVTDPRVSPCTCSNEGPSGAAWFYAIGDSASALHIAQDINGTVAVQNSTIANAGCTDVVTLPYVSPQPSGPVSPFGSTLGFQMYFGADIFNAGVTHYRWKYTNIYDANLNPIPAAFQVTTIIPGAIARPYLVTLSTDNLATHYCTLGAVGSSTDFAYHIPHQDITQETLIPAVDQALYPQWSDVNFVSAYLDTTQLTDGLYRFDLELLSQDASGNFTVVAVDKATFQVSEYATIGNSQNAPDNYLLPTQTSASTTATSLSFNVRIDNSPCVAHIYDAQLPATGALSGPCGFIKYDNTLEGILLSFEASQPRNFATFDYALIKGNNTVATGINPEGYVLSSVDGFNLSSGEFSAEFSVLSLLNGCVGQAAFSENLGVAAMATDGSVRLDGYDRSDVNAFALSNT